MEGEPSRKIRVLEMYVPDSLYHFSFSGKKYHSHTDFSLQPSVPLGPSSPTIVHYFRQHKLRGKTESTCSQQSVLQRELQIACYLSPVTGPISCGDLARIHSYNTGIISTLNRLQKALLGNTKETDPKISEMYCFRSTN